MDKIKDKIEELKLSLPICKVCEKDTTTKCGLCKLVHYCSKECQTSDWHYHRAIYHQDLITKAFEEKAKRRQEALAAWPIQLLQN